MPFTRKVQMDDPNFRIQFLTQAPSTTDLCQTTGASKCRKICDTHTRTDVGQKGLMEIFVMSYRHFLSFSYHFLSFSHFTSSYLYLRSPSLLISDMAASAASAQHPETGFSERSAGARMAIDPERILGANGRQAGHGKWGYKAGDVIAISLG